MVPIRLSNESLIWILFPSCDLNRENKTALLPDALDELDAFQQPQGLVVYSLRRVRRVECVEYVGLICKLLPPYSAFACRIPHCICLEIFLGFDKGPSWTAPLLPKLSATGSRVAICGDLRPQ